MSQRKHQVIEQKHGVARNGEGRIVRSYYEGPIPTPELLKGFEEILPGAADRILSMTEKEGEHRRSIQRRGHAAYILNERIGMFFAFLICSIAIAAGTFCIIKGAPAAGAILPAIPLATIVIAFIHGRAGGNKPQSKKSEEEK